jgi:hypothetical protein
VSSSAGGSDRPEYAAAQNRGQPGGAGGGSSLSPARHAPAAVQELVLEAHRRCVTVMAHLALGNLTDEQAVAEYAWATAPLASAARVIESPEQAVIDGAE